MPLVGPRELRSGPRADVTSAGDANGALDLTCAASLMALVSLPGMAPRPLTSRRRRGASRRRFDPRLGPPTNSAGSDCDATVRCWSGGPAGALQAPTRPALGGPSRRSTSSSRFEVRRGKREPERCRPPGDCLVGRRLRGDLGFALVWSGIQGDLKDLDRAEDLLRQSLALAERVDDRRGSAHAYRALGLAQGNARKDPRGAIPLFEQSMALFEALGERWELNESLIGLANNTDSRATRRVAESVTCGASISWPPAIVRRWMAPVPRCCRRE